MQMLQLGLLRLMDAAPKPGRHESQSDCATAAMVMVVVVPEGQVVHDALPISALYAPRVQGAMPLLPSVASA